MQRLLVLDKLEISEVSNYDGEIIVSLNLL